MGKQNPETGLISSLFEETVGYLLYFDLKVYL